MNKRAKVLLSYQVFIHVDDQMKKIIIASALIIVCMHQVAVAKVPVVPKSWTGLYNDEQKIALFLTQNGSALKGYSILNGKQTPFVGSITESGKITLREQGAGASFGVFEFEYQNKGTEMDGSWVSSTNTVKPKFFSVNAQQCQYAKGEGDFPDASTRLLKDEDLQRSLGELDYMRNEIYARHGYAFKDKDWARTFSHQDWYMPCFSNVENRLTNIEKQNIKRIKMVAPYAEKMDWGR